MDRYIDDDERELPNDKPAPAPSLPPRENPSDRTARIHEHARSGRQIYSVTEDELKTMVDIGRFRVVAGRHLAEVRYQGAENKMRQDLRALLKQGLVQRKTIWTGRDKETISFWALTKTGKSWLKRQQILPQGQAIYSGFVKPAELRHDAAIYVMYQKESQKIEREGSKIRRIVLDYELKKKAFSPLAKAKALGPQEYAARQVEVAREYGLKIVNGHLTLPDLRIEYETRQGGAAHVDLEVASKSYHGSHAAEKAAAGFTIYADAETAARLSRVLDEREITAEILSL